jgi:hypothetical protein
VKNKAYYLLFAFLFLIVVGIIIAILIYANKVEDEKIIKIDEVKEQAVQIKQKTWLDTLSQIKNNSYMQPVNMLYIDATLQSPPKTKKKETYYKLQINKVDDYSLFCVAQVLEKFNIQYSIQKDKKNLHILIKSKTKDILYKISKELKKYNITPKIYKETK